MDDLASTYRKLSEDKLNEVRLYESNIYYVRYLIQDLFNINMSMDKVYGMLYEEGLLMWKSYVPAKYVQRMKRLIGEG